MGQADLKTALRDHNWVSDADLREGVKKLQRDVG
jgi:hypothetical protein